MISGVTDQRRKLSEQDYQRIQFQNNTGYTIRAIAGEHNISTKFVRKLLDGGEVIDENQYNIRSHNCSGCGRLFDYSGLSLHVEIWSSGNNPMTCFTVIAGYHP